MYAVVVCISYLVVGLFLIMLNQHILKALHFPYPMFLSGLGILMSGIVSYLIILTGCVTIQKKEQVSGRLWYTRVLPIGLASATTLSFGNMVCLIFFSTYIHDSSNDYLSRVGVLISRYRLYTDVKDPYTGSDHAMRCAAQGPDSFHLGGLQRHRDIVWHGDDLHLHPRCQSDGLDYHVRVDAI